MLLYKTKSASAVAINRVFLDQPFSSVPAGLVRAVPAPRLVSHRDTDSESVGTASCRPEGGAKVCVLTSPLAGVVLPNPTGDIPLCRQATERYSSHFCIPPVLGAHQPPALQVSGSLATRCDNSWCPMNPWAHTRHSEWVLCLVPLAGSGSSWHA